MLDMFFVNSIFTVYVNEVLKGRSVNNITAYKTMALFKEYQPYPTFYITWITCQKIYLIKENAKNKAK